MQREAGGIEEGPQQSTAGSGVGPAAVREGEQPPRGIASAAGEPLPAPTPCPVRETDGNPSDILRESSPRVETTPAPAWLSI